MGRFKAMLLALALALAAATTLSACGGSDSPDLLPGETASEIKANLDLVEELVASGDCVGASNAAAAVEEQVEGLGDSVDSELKQALGEGAARLNEVVVECNEASEEETVPTTGTEEEPEEKDREKEEKAAAKEAEKEQKEEEKGEKETPPTETPGQEKQQEETEPPPTETPSDGGTPSGGVSPSAPAGGE